MKDQLSLEDTESSILLKSAWERVIQRMAQEVQEPIMVRFIKPLTPVAMVGNSVRIAAPGRFLQEWVRERFAGIIQSYLSDELGQSIELEVVAKPQAKSDHSMNSTPMLKPTDSNSQKFQPNDKYKFDSYIVGQFNRLAVAGAKAVAKDPGQKFNPLFIYGSSGLGKTHLLHALAREIQLTNPGEVITYISAQQFTEDFVNALQANRVEQFRRQHRQVGVWLVDDIQFLASKDKTQEEIFHTFNYLHSTGKQIVITSDRPPKDIYQMDERLRSRFESGLVADIQMPDTETKCAIIQSKAKAMDADLSFEVALYLAGSIPGNIRNLEGAITRLVTLASLENCAPDQAFAEKLVDQYYQDAFTKPGFQQIVEVVSNHMNISVEDMQGASRKAPIVHARHVAIYLTRRITGDSWKHIGSQFGDRDHTSIMHGYQKIDEMMHHDRELLGQVKGLMRQLNPQ